MFVCVCVHVCMCVCVRVCICDRTFMLAYGKVTVCTIRDFCEPISYMLIYGWISVLSNQLFYSHPFNLVNINEFRKDLLAIIKAPINVR